MDGLRALAALSVLSFHFFRASLATDPDWLGAGPLYWIDRLGALGVAVFFVISGFLLYRPFVLAALGDRPAPRVGRYYLRRALRIFPAYWFALTFYLFVFGPDQVHDVGDALVYYGLAQNYRSGSLLLGLGVAWTLAIEVSFYIVLPVLAAGLRALSNAIDPAQRLRGQLVGLTAMYVIGVAVRAWAAWGRGHIVESHGEWHPWRFPELWLPGFLDWFALGMAFALASAWVARGGRLWLPLRALGRYPAVSWGLAGLVYWTTQQVHFPEITGSRPGATQLLETATQTLARTSLLPLAAMLLVLPAVFGPQHRGTIRRLLRTRTMVWLGTVSYGIYLWHFVAIGETRQWILEDRFPESVILQLSAVLVLTLSAAAVSYYLLERPCVRLARALTSPRSHHL